MKKKVTFAKLAGLSLLISLTGCDVFGLLEALDNELSTTPSEISSGTTDKYPTGTGTVNTNTETLSVPYVQGDMTGKDEFYSQMSNSFSKTSGALLQAILSVNSFLYTDISVTDIEKFKIRKSEADKALATLEKYAKETETIITQSENLSLSQKSFQTKGTELTPEEVLVTVSSGPANKQLKTLMQTYQVNARAAKDILDKAMSGLSSKYNKEADFYDTAMRTATLVKEGANLTLTVAGTIVTAGGVGGTLTVLQAGAFLIKGVDGAVKVTKAGLELAVGKDVKQPDGTFGTFLTGLSGASELISISKLKGPWPTGNWADLTDKDKAGYISRVYSFGKKTIDSLGSGNKEIDLGENKAVIKNITQNISDVISKDIPSTLPGTYKISGEKKVVPQLPEVITNLINSLPDSDKIESINIIVEIVNKPTTQTGIYSRLVTSLKADDYYTPFIILSGGSSLPAVGGSNFRGDTAILPLAWNGNSYNIAFDNTDSSITRIPGLAMRTTMKGTVDFTKNILLTMSTNNVSTLDGKVLSTSGFSAKNIPLTFNGDYLECDIAGKDVAKYVDQADIDAGSTIKSVNWDNARLQIYFKK